jgi:hypothetical protein
MFKILMLQLGVQSDYQFKTEFKSFNIKTTSRAPVFCYWQTTATAIALCVDRQVKGGGALGWEGWGDQVWGGCRHHG